MAYPHASKVYKYDNLCEKNHQYIVLDLDSTLLCSSDIGDTEEYLQSYTEFNNRGMLDMVYHKDDWQRITHFRPYLQEFMYYCKFRFKDVIIWSAGGDEYVEGMCEEIQNLVPITFKLILTKSATDFPDDQPNGRKDLQKVYCAMPACNSKNTFIIDDHETTFLTDPDNGILIPEYQTADIFNPTPDINLKILMEWMQTEEVVTSRDIRELNKTGIFTSFLYNSDSLSKYMLPDGTK